MPQTFRGKLILVIVGTLLLAGAIYAFRGYLDLARITEEHEEVLAENARLEEENRHLKASIEALKTDDAAVEKVAREKLGLIKEDEVIYQLPE